MVSKIINSIFTILVFLCLLFLLYYGARKIAYDVFFNRGARLEARGDIVGSIKNLERAANFTWSQSSIYARIGDVAIREHDAILVTKKESQLGKDRTLKIAEENFLKSLKYNPQNPWAWSGLSEYFERKSYMVEKQEIINISKLPYGDLGKLDYEDWMAIATVKKAIEIEPNNHFYHDLLGFILMENNLTQQALTEYELAIEILPVTNEHFFIPEQAIPEEVFKAIEQGLEKALESSELIGKGKIYTELGMWMLYQQKFDSASEYFNKALLKGYEKHVLFGKLGIINYLQKNYDKSLEYLSKAIEGEHNKSYELYLMGKIFCEKGDHEQALSYFKQSKNHTTTLRGRQLYLLRIAEEYEHLKDLSNAETCYLDALRVNPDNPKPYLKIAEFYRKIENFEKSEKYNSLFQSLTSESD